MVEMVARDPTGRQTKQRGGASNKKKSVCFLGLLGLSLEYDGAMRESPRRREETGKEEIRHQANRQTTFHSRDGWRVIIRSHVERGYTRLSPSSPSAGGWPLCSSNPPVPSIHASIHACIHSCMHPCVHACVHI